MTTRAPKIISQGEMLAMIHPFTDAETRERLLQGEITLKSTRGVFQCERRLRATPGTSTPATPSTTPAPTPKPSEAAARDGYLGFVYV